jgi:hypothetical protein
VGQLVQLQEVRERHELYAKRVDRKTLAAFLATSVSTIRRWHDPKKHYGRSIPPVPHRPYGKRQVRYLIPEVEDWLDRYMA